MKLFLLLSIFSLFIASTAMVLAQTSPPAQPLNLNDVQMSGIFNKLSDIFNRIIEVLGKIILPFKEIIKFLGTSFIWVLGLFIKLIQWGLSYLD